METSTILSTLSLWSQPPTTLLKIAACHAQTSSNMLRTSLTCFNMYTHVTQVLASIKDYKDSLYPPQGYRVVPTPHGGELPAHGGSRDSSLAGGACSPASIPP
ncbi:hypothetical protein HOY82DRAFT_669483 [Tuber indicum]|nr:hypothetical protein HOY82DRAFT_669483 [Tuber indicum]